MIETVDSSKIDLTAARAFIAEPKKVTLSDSVDNYKKEVRLKIFQLKSDKFYSEINPYRHANQILEIVAASLGFETESLKSKNRVRTLVEARQIYCFIAIKMSTVNITLKIAGDLIERDHATVLHGVSQTISLNDTNAQFAEKLKTCINEYKKKFQGVENIAYEYNNIPQF